MTIKLHEIYSICTRCAGTGEATEPVPGNGEGLHPCPDCEATGRILIGWMNEEEIELEDED